MSIRLKLIMFMFAFLAAAAVLGMGALYIFSNLNRNLSLTNQEIEANRQFIALRGSIRELVKNAEGWALTGNRKYLAGYKKCLPGLYRNFGDVQLMGGGDVHGMSADFDEARTASDTIFTTSNPVGNGKVALSLKDLESSRDRLFGSMDSLYEQSITTMAGLSVMGQRIRRTTTGYLVLLVSFVSLAFIFLALFMRRMLSQPFNEMLEATEKVASGDLAYRIPPGRKDEFGLIGARFNRMLERLEESSNKLGARLKETELLLEVARIAGATPELKEALTLIVETVSKALGTEFCAVFLLYPEIEMFVLEASNTDETLSNISLPVDSYIARGVLDTMKPVLIDDMGEGAAAGGGLCGRCGSLIAAPILRDNICKGILILGRPSAGGFSPDEKNTAMILAHTTGAVVKNSELYSTTKKQLKQLSVTYELNRLLTSVYKPEDLLATISAEIAKLSGARICIIRLLEGESLNIKSSYGISPEETEEKSLKVGEGIAGWVVREGRSLFVEDVAKLPEGLKPKTIRAKSAICVPLRIGNRIIGTLGIYDKAGESGAPKPFDLEDLNMAEGFASMSAITIEKARMEEEQESRRREVFEANKRLDLLFETVQGGIVSLDSDYKILAANRYVERWMDLPLSEVIGKNAKDIFHPKGGICPHCAARSTFDTGDISAITQSNGLNYAELTAYPVKGEDGRVDEAVIFIQDITDRVLYQEEIMGLYREVAQTKEYLESLINNSADAIVTTDLKGNIISWNRAAEEIYGFTESEVMGKFLPFLPESAFEQENAYMERIREGDVIKAEALRLTKGGSLIEVSLTLSPIKDAIGEVIGISGISQDITKKKQVERELIRRNQELSRLFFISSAMRGTLDLERLLRMILTAVTMGDGLGFNRAILFWVDEPANVLRGAMGVGPASADEAGKIWQRLTTAHSTLHDIIREMEETTGTAEESSFDRLAKEIKVDLAGDTVMAGAVRDMKPFNVAQAAAEPFADPSIVRMLGSSAYAGVPLISRNRVVGVFWVDNLFNGRPITEEDMKFLNTFSNQMAAAIENARLFEGISVAEARSE
nr:GAF domain-containing protein [Nitrospiraceae bacterium]